jgi:hypothetical protein
MMGEMGKDGPMAVSAGVQERKEKGLCILGVGIDRGIEANHVVWEQDIYS